MSANNSSWYSVWSSRIMEATISLNTTMASSYMRHPKKRNILTPNRFHVGLKGTKSWQLRIYISATLAWVKFTDRTFILPTDTMPFILSNIITAYLHKISLQDLVLFSIPHLESWGFWCVNKLPLRFNKEWWSRGLVSGYLCWWGVEGASALRNGNWMSFRVIKKTGLEISCNQERPRMRIGTNTHVDINVLRICNCNDDIHG